MNLSSLKNVTKIKPIGRAGLVAKKYAPQIMTGAGVAGVIVSTVLTSKATLKLEEVVDKHKVDIDKVKAFAHEKSADEYSSTDAKKDLTIVYTRAAVDVVKLYALPVSLGVASLGLIIGGQGMQYKRTVASVAAYKSLEQTFNKYRDRVAEELGLTKEREFYNGYSKEEAENGDVKITVDPKGFRGTTAVFDQTNINWVNNAESNLMYVRCQEKFADQRLKARGHLFLNEVLHDLGLPHTKEGSVLGWIVDDEPTTVDFGIEDLQNSRNRQIFGLDDQDAIVMNFHNLELIWDRI